MEMDYHIRNYKGEDVLEAVHAINFRKGGILDISGEELTYDRDFRKAKPCRLCDECNECTPVTINGDDTYKFTNVSHGAHILDYIKAYNLDNKHEKISVEGWSDYPVIFVMENPSVNDKDGSLYNQDWKDWGNSHNKKFTPNRWYWAVGRYDKMPQYPEYFVQKAYSGLFLSVANTFKLKNAYLTNMVKCGIGCQKQDEKGKKREIALNTGSYNPEIVSNCIVERLKKEIDVLRCKNNDKVTVFAFGKNAYNGVDQYRDILGNIDVYELPHPAAKKLSNDDRRNILFRTISAALDKNIGNISFDKEKLDGLVNIVNNFRSIFSNIIFTKPEWAEGKTYIEGCRHYKIYSDCAIFKYKVKKGERLADEDSISQVIWIKYNFSNSSYDVWTGKTVKSEKRTNTNLEKYSFYNEVKEIIDKVLKAE